jgi:chromosome segregation ATPase
MIKKALIKNFQAHEKRVIKFDPNITTITGATDIGKSSIVRALRWWAINKPRGTSFIRDTEKGLTATVKVLVDKSTITRRRGLGINEYTLGKVKFEAFDSDIPEEIKKIINLEDWNFEGQHEAPYWFSETPGKIGQQLNQIVDLDIIDSTFKNLNSMTQKSKWIITLAKEEIQSKKVALGKLKHIKSMKKEFEWLDNAQEIIESENIEICVLRGFVEDTSKTLQKKERLERSCLDLRNALETSREWVQISQEAEELTELLQDITKTQSLIESEIPDVSGLMKIAMNWKRLEKFNNSLWRIIIQLRTESAVICRNEKSLLRKRKELKQMIGQICPLCGQKVRTKS